MSEPLIPDDLTLTERLVVHWVLNTIKARMLTGIPSGRLIDQAIEECEEVATRSTPT